MIFKKILILSFVMIFTFFLLACDTGEEKFANYNSGDKIILTTTNYSTFIDLYNNSLKSKESSDEYYCISYSYNSFGYSVLSYFNVEITITIRSKVLTENGKYNDLIFEKTLKLDKTGYVNIKDKYEFGTSYRNVKDLEWEVTKVSGFVVKK